MQAITEKTKTSRWARFGQQLERSGVATTHAVDACFKNIGSPFALGTPRARVVRIVEETSDVKSFWLRPNALVGGWTPGQHIGVSVEVDGVRRSRCYSLSSTPGEWPSLRITVKRQPGGVVSNALHDSLRVGALLDLGSVGGELALPVTAEKAPLFIAAGSGITPIRALLAQWLRRRPTSAVTLVYAVRRYSDVIFADEVEQLSARHPGLRVVHFVSGEAPRAGDEAGRVDVARLLAVVPDAWQRDVYLCGPAAFMQPLLEASREVGARVHHEYFAPPKRSATAGVALEDAELAFSRSGRTAVADGQRSLLEQAEAAGLTPAYGCRMGICNTCTCRKTSGPVRNLLTGEVNDQPDSDIRLCISAPAGDVTLDL